MVYCVVFFIITLGVLLLHEKQLQDERELRDYLLEKMREESN